MVNKTGSSNSTLKMAMHFTQIYKMTTIPIKIGEKAPTISGWQNLRLGAEDLPTYFAEPSNIGFLCGEPSDWIVDVDLDCHEACVAARHFLPDTGLIYGRTSNPRSHYLYEVDGIKTTKFLDPVRRGDQSLRGEAMLLEIRSTGCMSILPSSIHPSGETYLAASKGQPAVIDAKTLLVKASAAASAALLGRYWPHGARHETALALSGALLNHGYNVDQAQRLIAAVAEIAEDAEVSDRVATVRYTADKIAAEEPVTGIPSLITILGEEVVGAVIKWLQLDARRQTAQNETERNSIQINDRPLRDLVEDVLAELTRKNEPPYLYQREGQLVRIKKSARGIARIQPHSAETLRLLASQTADYVRVSQKAGKEGEIEEILTHALPPRDLMISAIVQGDYGPRIPILEGVTMIPVVSPEGLLEAKPGYLPQSRLYFQPPEEEFTLRERTAPVAREDVRESLEFIFEFLLHGFPFADAASKAHTLAALLEPILRPYINESTPLKDIDAPSRATGKSKLAETIIAVSSPGGINATTAPTSETEWRKAITTWLIPGPSFVFLDNVEGQLRSEALCAALTSGSWSDRLLGGNTQAHLPINCQWLMTSNNAQLHEDLVTRSVLIRLDSKMERPEQRQNFRCANPVAYVRAHRATIVDHALTLIHYWMQAGRPEYTGQGVSRFARWTQVMGGLMECVGVEGFLANQGQLADNANPERIAWRVFAEAWAEAHGDHQVDIDALSDIAFGRVVNDVRQLSEGVLTHLLTANNDLNRKIRLGKALGQNLHRVLAGHRIMRQNGRKPLYWLEPAEQGT